MFADGQDRREKQRQSSHDYRVKQKQRFEQLEQQVQQLSYENQQLRLQNSTNERVITQMGQNVAQITYMVGKLHEHILGRAFQPGEELQNQQSDPQPKLQFYDPQRAFVQQNNFSTLPGTQSNSSLHVQQNSIQSNSFQGQQEWPQTGQSPFPPPIPIQHDQSHFNEEQEQEPSFFYSFSNHGNVFVIIFFIVLLLPSFLFPQNAFKQDASATNVKIAPAMQPLNQQGEQNQYVKLSLLENLISQQQKQNQPSNSSGLIVYAQNQSIEQFCKDNCEGKVQ